MKKRYSHLLLSSFILATNVQAHDNPGKDKTWSEELAVFVEKLISNAYAEANIQIDYTNNVRTITANGQPNHSTGSFPNRNNPNSISTQSYKLQVPLNPLKNNRATEMRGGLIGIALNGVVFEPGTAETWNNDRRWRMEAINGPRNLGLDSNNAHVQPDGSYHYHGVPNGLINLSSQRNEAPVMLGYAADGFPMYNEQGYIDPNDMNSPLSTLVPSYRVKYGNRTSGPGGIYNGNYTADFEYVKGYGDLDECNGRFAKTPEYPEGTYHYVVTNKFPFISRCLMGTPDESFFNAKQGRQRGNRERIPFFNDRDDQGPRNGRGFNQGNRYNNQNRRSDGPPQAAYDACDSKSTGSACTVDTPHGELQGSCRSMRNGKLGCRPEGHREPPR